VTPAIARRVRHGLVVLAVAVVAWVGFSLRPRPRIPTAEPSTPALPGKPKTHMVEFGHRRVNEDGREIVVRAKESLGTEEEGIRLREAVVDFTYSVKGKLEKGSIASDTCLYTPTSGTAAFNGNVKVHTEDGFSLATDSLAYDDQRGVARTDAPVAFERKDISGTGTGLVYDSKLGTIQLDADAVVRIKDEDGTTEIRSQRAFLNRADQTVRFLGDAVMTKGDDELRSAELIVNFDDAGHAVQRAEAIGHVHARFTGLHRLGPVDATGGGGRRELTGEKLDMFFRPDRQLERMEAGPNGELTIFPGPQDPPERRRLSSRMLSFFFDEAGRLTEVQGHKDSRVVSEPVDAKGKGDETRRRTMDCQNFVARFDVETGQLDNGDFLKDVKFTWPQGEATGAMARYELHRVPGGLLMMKETDGVRPELHERRNGSHLSAVALDIEVETGNVAARKEVHHVIPPRAENGGLVGAEAETVITSRLFRYEPRRGVGVYTDDALLRSGADEVRGKKITVEQDGAVLRAEGDVVTVLTPKGKDAAKGPVEARAGSMIYKKAERRIDYAAEVTMKHGDFTTLSPKSTVFLNAEGRGFERLEAGSPVKIDQEQPAKREATSTWATYTPADKKVVLTGRAHLVDERGQVVRGDLVTFRLDEQAIFVEGREARSETILKKEVAVP
jgi:LPS export ABC transporter protein LptC/lipopolysaccharide transport protein LptA